MPSTSRYVFVDVLSLLFYCRPSRANTLTETITARFRPLIIVILS